MSALTNYVSSLPSHLLLRHFGDLCSQITRPTPSHPFQPSSYPTISWPTLTSPHHEVIHAYIQPSYPFMYELQAKSRNRKSLISIFWVLPRTATRYPRLMEIID